MLIVKTKVKESRIHGRGLFADQNIRKGQIISKYNPMIDRKIPQKKLSKLPSFIQKFVKYYSYLNKRNEFVLSLDDSRYINHSDRPNTCDILTFWDRLFGREGVAIANKDIKKGEEITSRYLKFDSKGKPRHII